MRQWRIVLSRAAEDLPRQKVEQLIREVEVPPPACVPGVEQNGGTETIRERTGGAASWLEFKVEDLDVTHLFQDAQQSLTRAFS